MRSEQVSGGDGLWAGGAWPGPGPRGGRGPPWEWPLTTTALWGGDGAAQEEGLAPRRVCLSFPCSPGQPRGTEPLIGCGQVRHQGSPVGSFWPRPLSFRSSRGGPRVPGWEHLLLHSWGHQLHSPSLGWGGLLRCQEWQDWGQPESRPRLPRPRAPTCPHLALAPRGRGQEAPRLLISHGTWFRPLGLTLCPQDSPPAQQVPPVGGALSS